MFSLVIMTKPYASHNASKIELLNAKFSAGPNRLAFDTTLTTLTKHGSVLATST